MRLPTLLLVFMLLGCEQKLKDTITVATSADNPPYEFIQNNQIVGLDIDVVNAIADNLGKKLIIKNLDFPGLLPSLTGGKADLVIAGLSVTTERLAKVDFSEIYTAAKIAVLYRKQDNLKDQSSLAYKNIGAQLGTIWGEIARELAGKYSAKVHFLSNNLMLVEELKSNVIDALILEAAQVNKFIIANPQLGSFVLENFSSEFAIAMPKNSPLKTDVDNAIRMLKQNGTINDINKKWLGENDY